MALVIENGSLVAGANSFVTVEEARAYANARASIFAVGDDPAAEVALIVAMDYLEARAFKGDKVSPGVQALQWPRENAIVEGWEIPIDTIPQAIKNAQCQLAIESANGLDLMPTGDGREVIREKLDVIETEWAEGGRNAQPTLSKVNAILANYLKTGGGLRTLRI